MSPHPLWSHRRVFYWQVRGREKGVWARWLEELLLSRPVQGNRTKNWETACVSLFQALKISRKSHDFFPAFGVCCSEWFVLKDQYLSQMLLTVVVLLMALLMAVINIPCYYIHTFFSWILRQICVEDANIMISVGHSRGNWGVGDEENHSLLPSVLSVQPRARAPVFRGQKQADGLLPAFCATSRMVG